MSAFCACGRECSAHGVVAADPSLAALALALQKQSDQMTALLAQQTHQADIYTSLLRWIAAAEDATSQSMRVVFDAQAEVLRAAAACVEARRTPIATSTSQQAQDLLADLNQANSSMQPMQMHLMQSSRSLLDARDLRQPSAAPPAALPPPTPPE